MLTRRDRAVQSSKPRFRKVVGETRAKNEVAAQDIKGENMSEILPIAGSNKSETIRNALLVKLCLDNGKTLAESIKLCNDTYSPVGCFSHENGIKANSCVALVDNSIVVYAQLDGAKHPLKPSRWNGSSIVRLKTTAMTDSERESIIPVTNFIRKMLSRDYVNSNSSIPVVSSGGGSRQSASSAAGIAELQALIAAAFSSDKKKKR